MQGAIPEFFILPLATREFPRRPLLGNRVNRRRIRARRLVWGRA
jgi:hypothetical protein